MTRMNHEKRNQMDKVGPSFSYEGHDDHLRYLAETVDELKAKIQLWELKSEEYKEQYDENELQINKLAYALYVECRHGFVVVECADCKYASFDDFQEFPEFENLLETKMQLSRAIQMADEKVIEAIGELQKFRR